MSSEKRAWPTATLVTASLLGGPCIAADLQHPKCMTHAEARSAYPKQSLYWRTAKRCWYAKVATKPVATEVKPKRMWYVVVPLPPFPFVPWQERIDPPKEGEKSDE